MGIDMFTATELEWTMSLGGKRMIQVQFWREMQEKCLHERGNGIVGPSMKLSHFVEPNSDVRMRCGSPIVRDTWPFFYDLVSLHRLQNEAFEMSVPITARDSGML